MSHIETYFNEVVTISQACLNESIITKIEDMVELLVCVRNNGGRVFILGVGGSAGNASHMVNDLRKLCNIEAYAPTDNVSELTARINDEGFESVFVEWLKISRLQHTDALFFLSVGGGNKERKLSENLISALDYAKKQDSLTLGIVGKSDGYVAQNADCVVVVPNLSDNRVTPHSEAFQGVIWHCLVSHPDLQTRKTTW